MKGLREVKWIPNSTDLRIWRFKDESLSPDASRQKCDFHPLNEFHDYSTTYAKLARGQYPTILTDLHLRLTSRKKRVCEIKFLFGDIGNNSMRVFPFSPPQKGYCPSVCIYSEGGSEQTVSSEYYVDRLIRKQSMISSTR
jgi:hypothetical protein